MSLLSQTILNSACMGALFILLHLGVWDLVRYRTQQALSNIAWLLSVMLFLAFASGWMILVYPDFAGWPASVGILVFGPLMGALSGLQLSYALSANHRDKVSVKIWKWSAWVGIALALVLLPFDAPIQLMGAMIITSLLLLISAGLCLRAALHGDKLGWFQAVGTLAGCSAVMAFCRQAMGHPMSTTMQWLSTGVLTSGLFMMNMLGRSRISSDAVEQTRKFDSSEYDALTRLYSSQAIVRMMIKSTKRQRWIAGEGAVIVVKLLNTDRIGREIGQNNLPQVYVKLANRLVTVVGGMDPVGHYYEGCYLVLIEKMHSEDSVEGLMRRIKQVLSEPLIMDAGKEAEPIVPIIGIGKSRLSFTRTNVDAALYEAQQEAESSA